jgi:biopolymer transport protein ExbD
MAFSMAGGGPSGPQINVTPLIDVLLTLIVVFMIVVAMEQDKGERVQIPQPQTQQTPEQKAIVDHRDPTGVEREGPASRAENQRRAG